MACVLQQWGQLGRYTPIGGKLTSSPALPTKSLNPARIDLVVTMDEERDLKQFVSTLWWKQFPKP